MTTVPHPDIGRGSPLLRAMGLGRAAYLLWHAPLAWAARMHREGGPVQQWLTSRGRSAMRTAASRLPSLPPPVPGASEIRFLTGKRFWYQTAFCAWSLRHFSGRDLAFVFHDDGTFDRQLAVEASRVFPGSRIVTAAEAEEQLERSLPSGRFPSLRAQRSTYLHLRKLVDCHVGNRGWRVVLDSDMLFFRQPRALLDWLAAPTRPVIMQDIKNSYGYPPPLLGSLVQNPIPDRVNVGICGLNSSAVDWDRIEHWCARLLREAGTSYYLEQALVALLLADQDALRLPTADYLLMPDDAECRTPTAVLHHYVDLSKRGYFRHAWRHLVP